MEPQEAHALVMERSTTPRPCTGTTGARVVRRRPLTDKSISLRPVRQESALTSPGLAARLVVLILVCSTWMHEAAADDALLFQAGAKDQPAVLVNPGQVKEIDGPQGKHLDLAISLDPYAKTEWRLKFMTSFLAEWDKVVFEVEYLDEGAGVIQPRLLGNDAHRGEWLRPQRAVSFTMLNTGQVRRALFAFPVPRLDWATTANDHLHLAGLQHLKAIRAYREVPEYVWQSAAREVPKTVTPLVSLKRPMAVTCTVGIPDTGNPPSLDTALEAIREYAPLARLLGFTSAECFVRWDLLERRPGEFDFSHYDTIVQALRERDMKWFPNLVITSAFALPSWYYDSDEYAGLMCLEHGEVNQVPSIWNDATRPHVERVLKAFGEHYVPMGVLEAVRLGPSGNFGEAQFPAGAGSALGYGGRPMHAHIGWWAGDAFARGSFQRDLRAKYGDIGSLNEAWSESYTSFEQVIPRLPETCRTRQARLDMTHWYMDAMTSWCEFWAMSAREAMPETPIYQSSGGWGFWEAGTDMTAQAESMRKVGGGIRLTNETDSFEQNVYATRLAATAARLYGIPLGYEPAGYHSARGVTGRFFSTATTNGSNLYTRHSVLFEDPYAVQQWLEGYPVLDARASPVIDVAVYYPQTMNQLDDGAFRHLYAWGFNPRAAEVRRRIDVDYLDERLIRQGFLDNYRVLVFCWGNIIEKDVQARIDQWMRAGGVIIYPSFPRVPLETIEGDQTVFQAWERGDTGQGAFHRFQGDMEPVTLYGDFIEKVLEQTPTLRPETRRMLMVRRPPRVFFSTLETGDMWALNYNDQAAHIELVGVFRATVPPYAVMIIPRGRLEAMR